MIYESQNVALQLRCFFFFFLVFFSVVYGGPCTLTWELPQVHKGARWTLFLGSLTDALSSSLLRGRKLVTLSWQIHHIPAGISKGSAR